MVRSSTGKRDGKTWSGGGWPERAGQLGKGRAGAQGELASAGRKLCGQSRAGNTARFSPLSQSSRPLPHSARAPGSGGLGLPVPIEDGLQLPGDLQGGPRVWGKAGKERFWLGALVNLSLCLSFLSCPPSLVSGVVGNGAGTHGQSQGEIMHSRNRGLQ